MLLHVSDAFYHPPEAILQVNLLFYFSANSAKLVTIKQGFEFAFYLIEFI